jgi:hypothetical protein
MNAMVPIRRDDPHARFCRARQRMTEAFEKWIEEGVPTPDDVLLEAEGTAGMMRQLAALHGGGSP